MNKHKIECPHNGIAFSLKIKSGGCEILTYSYNVDESTNLADIILSEISEYHEDEYEASRAVRFRDTESAVARTWGKGGVGS